MSLLPVLSPAQTPLGKVIEGAKKEGAITMISPTGFTVKSFERLRREIREKYGVDLKFKYMPGHFMSDLAKAIAEAKAGVPPTWDLSVVSGSTIMRHINAGTLEKVDWEPLLAPETPREIILGRPPQLEVMHGYALTMKTIHEGGITYNPAKVHAGKLPKSWSNLADPKWKGELGLNKSASFWVMWAWFHGKEKVLPQLRAVLKNRPILGGSKDLMSRFVMGEISMAHMSSGFLPRISKKGVLAEWQPLDISVLRDYPLAIRKETPHLNAAKLVTIYLTSPEGYKLVKDESGSGNIYYPDNFEHDIVKQDKERGVTVIKEGEGELLSFFLTEEAETLEKEVKKIMAGG